MKRALATTKSKCALFPTLSCLLRTLDLLLLVADAIYVLFRVAFCFASALRRATLAGQVNIFCLTYFLVTTRDCKKLLNA